MFPWVGPHAPSFGRQLCRLPSRVEYPSPQGVLLLLVYRTTASPLWLELRGLSAWQATPSWTVYRLTCQRLLPWLRVTFAIVPDAAWPGSDQRPWGTAPAAGPMGWLGRPSAPDPWGVGPFLSLSRPTCARVCGVLGNLAPVHPWPAWCVALLVRCPLPLGSCSPCARSVCCFGCAVCWATWLLFTGVPARCVAFLVRCPGPLGSCSPACPLGALPVCAVSWATWLLFTVVPARRVVWRVRCPGPLGSCSPMCPLGALPVSVVSWATWFLITGVPARHVVLRVGCPGPLGSCSPMCPFGVLCCVCGVLGQLAPVHRCARRVCCVACAVSWVTLLLFTGVLARCIACVCGVLGHLAPVHRCARSACCVACAVSWATWLLFTGVPARLVVLRVPCPGPLGSCSPVCPLCVLCGVCGVLGHLAPVHRCARSVCCLCVRCPRPLGSCSPVCPLGALLCVCGVLGHLAPVHRCARSVCCLCVRCPGPLGSCSPVYPLGVLFCLCGVLGHSPLVHRCARSVRCFACAVSWAMWLLFTGVPARCFAFLVRCPGPLVSCSPVCPLRALPVCAVSWTTWLLFTCVPAWCVVFLVRCPGPLGSCSPVFPLGVLCRVCGVLGHLAPVHRCAGSVCCFACAVSWATWLLFTSVPARCVVLRVRCPGPLGSCSPVCPLGVLCCVCGVLGHLAPVHGCACLVCCVACALA